MSRAIHEIQSEATRLTEVSMMGAIEAENWVAVTVFAQRLIELAQRGIYHSQIQKVGEIGAFAMGNHAEQDAR